MGVSLSCLLPFLCQVVCIYLALERERFTVAMSTITSHNHKTFIPKALSLSWFDFLLEVGQRYPGVPKNLIDCSSHSTVICLHIVQTGKIRFQTRNFACSRSVLVGWAM